MSGLTMIGVGAKLLGVKSAVSGVVSKIPTKVWYALAIVAGVLILIWGHQHIAHKALKAQYTAGYAAAKADDQKQLDQVKAQALALRTRVEQLNTQASQLAREAHNAKISSVGNDVADIVRGGAGKASCGYVHYPAPAASAGGSQPVSGTGGPAAPQVLDSGGTELVALPLNDVARLFGQCDINRDAAQRWNSFWGSLVKNWPVH